MNAEIKPRLDMWLEAPRGSPCETQELCRMTRSHNFYRITTSNEEVWAMDPTGAQFGNAEFLVPWSEYCRRWVQQQNFGWELGLTRKVMQASIRASVDKPIDTLCLPEEPVTKELEPFLGQWAQFSKTGLYGSLFLPDPGSRNTETSFWKC